MKAAGLPELTCSKDIQYLKVSTDDYVDAAVDSKDTIIWQCFGFLFSKGLFGFGQIRGGGPEEFQSEIQRSSAGKLEDKGQLDDALLGQR